METQDESGARDVIAEVSWPVRSERLLLRRGIEADAEATWVHRKLPEVQEWIGFAPTDFGAYREAFTAPHRLPALVIVQLGDTVIGDLMLRVEDAYAQVEVVAQAKGTQAELGWSFNPAYGGQGYATEAVRALIDVCFGPMGLRRVHAECFADNEPSWRLMERVGMRREKHSRESELHRDGRWLDGLDYAILASEWPISSVTH
jgi:RimJ/RimL family protein N-acetyltransferase